jgi:hypothetical protein
MTSTISGQRPRTKFKSRYLNPPTADLPNMSRLFERHLRQRISDGENQHVISLREFQCPSCGERVRFDSPD